MCELGVDAFPLSLSLSMSMSVYVCVQYVPHSIFTVPDQLLFQRMRLIIYSYSSKKNLEMFILNTKNWTQKSITGKIGF